MREALIFIFWMRFIEKEDRPVKDPAGLSRKRRTGLRDSIHAGVSLLRAGTGSGWDQGRTGRGGAQGTRHALIGGSMSPNVRDKRRPRHTPPTS